jgi:hypothetical protein
MNDVLHINEVIGLDVYMNCVLVNAGLRNAMLIQPADYKEVTSAEPITASKIKVLMKIFPDLIASNIHGETIISKKAYSEANIKTDANMGTILGFPCADEYTYTLEHPDEPRMSISIIVKLKPGGNDENIQIIAYVCKYSEDDAKYKSASVFAEKAAKILKADPIVGKIVEDVKVVNNTHMPPKYLINALLNNTTLSKRNQSEIINYIWNLSLEGSIKYNYDFKNPVHRGIMIGLLALYDNNPIEPFYPLQYRPESKAVDIITEKLDKELEAIFNMPKPTNQRKTQKAKNKPNV